MFGAAPCAAERAALELELSGASGGCDRQRLKVDRSAVRRGARRARPHTALYLNRVDAVRQIGEVREVQDLVFRIVQRNAVEREIDARLVDAPQPDVAVPPIIAGLGVRGERRRSLEYERDVLSERASFELGSAYGFCGDGCVVAGAD